MANHRCQINKTVQLDRRSQNGEMAEADMAEAVTADAPKADDDQTEARGSLPLLYWADHR